MIAAVFVCGVGLTAAYYQLLKRPTDEGRAALDALARLKMYLAVAEKDRLNLANPPERTSELFERFLPYALALESTGGPPPRDAGQ